MDTKKTLRYNWEFGRETVAIRVSSYRNNGNLYVGLCHKEGRDWEDFGDVTINLPYQFLEPNEAFITGDFTKDMLHFIKEHKLGKVLNETGRSGYATYTYNEQNKLTSATGYNGATVTYSYDGNGNMVTSTKPDGTAITYTYDDKHRMVSQTDGRGVTTTYSYDGPNMTGYVDGNGAAWGFTYDAMNRAVTMTDPLGNVTSNSYDANGNLTSKTAADGGVTAYTLDGVGNITASTDALGNTTTYTYDKMYNMTSGTDPKGNQISYVYDKNYQQVKATDAMRIVISLIAVLLASISTAVAGVISFLGLIVPHIGRILVGSDHKALVPFSALFGAFTFLLADTIGRTIAAPYEVSASIIMSVVGGPFFIILLRRSKKYAK